MITTSQKARLCEMAQQLKPIFEIGKHYFILFRTKYYVIASINKVPHGYIVSAGYIFSRVFSFLEKLKKAQIYFIKNREFDGFLGFLAGSYEGAYFGVRNRARFCQNAKKAQIIGF